MGICGSSHHRNNKSKQRQNQNSTTNDFNTISLTVNDNERGRKKSSFFSTQSIHSDETQSTHDTPIDKHPFKLKSTNQSLSPTSEKPVSKSKTNGNGAYREQIRDQNPRPSITPSNDDDFPKQNEHDLASSPSRSVHSSSNSSKPKYTPSNEQIISSENKTGSSKDESAPNNIYEVIRSFEATHPDELTVHVGDKLLELDHTYKGFIHVRQYTTDSELTKLTKRGSVPEDCVSKIDKLHVEKWFFGNIGRHDAQTIIGKPEYSKGTFLIAAREGNDPNRALVLTVRTTNEVAEDERDKSISHYCIKRTKDGKLYIEDNLLFDNLHELVQHYKENDGLATRLLQPAKRAKCFRHKLFKNIEIARADIRILELLGEGNFGQVKKGLWNDEIQVAVKEVRSNQMTSEQFFHEAEMTRSCQHENLVKMYGICSSEPIWIITEFLENGSLIDFLQSGDGKLLTIQPMIKILINIASGMAYLESRKLVHLDLAARNVLLGEFKNSVPTAKVADFGLARLRGESVGSNEHLPVRWSAPEVLFQNQVTTKADVWSFGVLIVEIVTLGHKPYSYLKTNAELVGQLKSGHKHERPSEMNKDLYKICLDCWNESSKRPSFSRLKRTLTNYYKHLQ